MLSCENISRRVSLPKPHCSVLICVMKNQGWLCFFPLCVSTQWSHLPWPCVSLGSGHAESGKLPIVQTHRWVNAELARSPLAPSPTLPPPLCFVSVSSHVTSFSLNVDPKCSPVSCFLLKPCGLGVVLVKVYSRQCVLEKKCSPFSGRNFGFSSKILRALILIMRFYDDLRQRQWLLIRHDIPPEDIWQGLETFSFL